MKKKVLLIGGSGFIGKHYSKLLSAYDIYIADLITPSPDQDHEQYFYLDIRDSNAVKEFFQKISFFDHIVLLAAEHKDFGVLPEAYYKTNCEGTQNVLNCINISKTNTLTFFSSVAVYGDTEIPKSEDDLKQPSNDYGKSKLQAEKLIQKWHKNTNIKTVIVRPSVVYGEENYANMYKLIHQIKKKRFFFIGLMKNIKSICYVKNLVSACMFMVNKEGQNITIFNYADKKQLTAREISAIIAKKLNVKLATVPYWLIYTLAIPFDFLSFVTQKDFGVSTKRISKLCTQTFFHAKKIEQAGYVPTYNNTEGIKRMVDWIEYSS